MTTYKSDSIGAAYGLTGLIVPETPGELEALRLAKQAAVLMEGLAVDRARKGSNTWRDTARLIGEAEGLRRMASFLDVCCKSGGGKECLTNANTTTSHGDVCGAGSTTQ